MANKKALSISLILFSLKGAYMRKNQRRLTLNLNWYEAHALQVAIAGRMKHIEEAHAKQPVKIGLRKQHDILLSLEKLLVEYTGGVVWFHSSSPLP